MLVTFSKRLWVMVNNLYAGYRLKMAGLSLLGAVSSFLEGIGISFLIPLLVFFVGGNHDSSNFATKIFSEIFSRLGISINFKVLFTAVVVLFLLKAVVLFWFGYFRAKTVASYRMATRKNLYRHFLTADFSYLRAQKAGHLEVVIMGEVKQSSKLLENIIGLILSLSSIVAFAVVSAFISWQITAVSLFGGVLFLLFFKPLVIRIRNYSKTLIATGKKVSHMLVEMLYGIKTLKTMGVETAVLSRALPLFQTFEKLEFRKQIAKHIAKVSLEPFSIFFITGVFAVSYFYLKFSVTSFIAVIYLIHKIFSYIDKVQSAIHVMSETMPSAETVVRTLSEIKGQAPRIFGSRPFSFSHELKMESVSFNYGGASILKGINLQIKKGESVGIIGPSGAGKTTIVDLLLRLYNPESGSIKLDHSSIGEVRMEDWRRAVVYVPQDVFLLNASVADNIRFFDDSITDDEIKEASRRAHIYELIASLPEGFNSKAGERGSRFSGGERQRIAFARALARKPSILILDEATSALDADAEAVIKDTLVSLKGEITLIVIAHKPSTIDYVDRVIAIRDGSVVEEGSPAELLTRKDSYFKQIYERGSALY